MVEIVIGLIIGLAAAAGVYWIGRRELAGVRDEATELRSDLTEAGDVVRKLGEDKARAESDANAYQREAATRTEERDEALRKLGLSEEKLARSESRLAGVEADHAARVDEMNTFRAELEDRFKGIASNVTQSTREDFIKEFRDLTSEETAKSIERMDKTVKPLRESIEKLDKQSQEMEQVRQKAYGSVEEMIAGTGRQINELNLTTTGLRQALSAPQQRGRWGELTLERVLEVSGMLEHVTYERQHHTPGEDGAVRPDAIIHMPRELTVPVDAKAPLSSYLEAHDAADDSQQRAALEQHARSLMGHARQLGSKSYAEAIEGQSPDFVVLFLPAETILDAAMTAQPSIWEDAWTRHRVLIATPGLLIALLRTIGVAWQQEEIQRNAQDIADAAKLLYDRLGTFTKHVDGVGGALDRAVKAYNESVGSFERRVLPQARRMEELGAVGDGQRIEEPRVLEGSTRQLNAPELNARTD